MQMGKLLLTGTMMTGYAVRRIKYQVEALKNNGTDVCGTNKLLYYDLCNNRAYQYIYPPDQRTGC
jgi:hypothetical protein